ncbi:MAG: hypothetical protein H0V47_11610 [Chloroflexia bacterium]|nr:hypothetical protein [Chloroflexia bacterium]
MVHWTAVCVAVGSTVGGGTDVDVGRIAVSASVGSAVAASGAKTVGAGPRVSVGTTVASVVGVTGTAVASVATWGRWVGSAEDEPEQATKANETRTSRVTGVRPRDKYVPFSLV